MGVLRKRYNTETKALVALKAIKGQKTAYEIAAEYVAHPEQIAQWKKQVLDEVPHIFSSLFSEQKQGNEALTATLYQEIGYLTMQLDLLKENQVSLLSTNII